MKKKRKNAKMDKRRISNGRLRRRDGELLRRGAMEEEDGECEQWAGRRVVGLSLIL